MKTKMAIRDALLLNAILGGLRITDALRRRLEQLAKIIEAAALAGLSKEALHRLTVAIYDRKGVFRTDKGLFVWEQEWFAADLPRPPAKLLVGGAGSGREIVTLTAAGYQILAFDPAPQFVRHARGLAHLGSTDFIEASYEDLVFGDTMRAGKLRTAIERFGVFDAVIFGWGSFTHIMDAATRARLLERLHPLCPIGPVLLSFWVRTEPDSRLAKGRAARLGAALGRAIGPAAHQRYVAEAGDIVTSQAGFGHFFTWAEIADLAAQCGYEVHLKSQDDARRLYPHVTLRPAVR